MSKVGLLKILMIVIATLMLLPVFLSLMASIKAPSEAQLVPTNYFPIKTSLENYLKVFSFQAGLWSYVWNSLFTAMITIILCVGLSLPAGYGLARYNFPFKEGWFLVLLATMMIPFQALLTPLYLMFAKLGLANSHLGLAIVHTVIQLPFSIYLMRNSFEAVPKEIEEAALVDNCSPMRMLFKVFMPLVKPGIITVALFAFIASWNEFIAALIFMNNEKAFTVPIMLVSVRTGRFGSVDWGALQAGVILSIIPCILVYLSLQRHYISGFLSGAVK
jgi:multiple sugar transport system permease protein